jgi:tetratricopeptide (TPR) repeat protein
MAKVIKFPAPTPSPEKFGLQKAKSKHEKAPPKQSQLNLFAGGKIIKLHQLTHFDEALMLDDQGDRKTARKHYLRSIQEREAVADSYCNLGILECEEGHTTKAIDCFTQSLKVDPRHFESHYNLANLYAEVGNFALAKVHYEVSIEIEPSFPNSYFNLGLTLAICKDFKEAVRFLYSYKNLTPGEEHATTDDLIGKLNELQ